MRTGKNFTPLPYRYYYLPVLFLIIAGLINNGYLALLHYRNYTDITYSSFCALTKTINCDTVAQSPWSIIFGVPVALWGIYGYLLYGLLLITARKRTPDRLVYWNPLLLLGGIFTVATLYLGTISALKIHSYCILCLVSYVISLLLLFYPWLIRRRFACGSLPQGLRTGLPPLFRNRLAVGALICLVASFVAIKLYMPHYWQYQLPEPDTSVATGITDNGSPWIGAAKPELTIEEYSDYQCFQCYKTHFMLRRLVARYPDRIRLVHHHYPMDSKFNKIVVPEPFHVGAGKMALVAIYAAGRGKFWPMNDLLFELGRNKEPFNTETLAQKTRLTSGGLVWAVKEPNNIIHRKLQMDIRQGMKLGITGTPSFIINGHVYQGSIPSGILKDILK